MRRDIDNEEALQFDNYALETQHERHYREGLAAQSVRYDDGRVAREAAEHERTIELVAETVRRCVDLALEVAAVRAHVRPAVDVQGQVFRASQSLQALEDDPIMPLLWHDMKRAFVAASPPRELDAYLAAAPTVPPLPLLALDGALTEERVGRGERLDAAARAARRRAAAELGRAGHARAPLARCPS